MKKECVIVEDPEKESRKKDEKEKADNERHMNDAQLGRHELESIRDDTLSGKPVCQDLFRRQKLVTNPGKDAPSNIIFTH